MNRQQRVVRVLVVDDHPVIREGLRTMLSSDPGIEVIGEAGSGEEAISLVNLLKPDVVLTDIRMPGMSGIELTERIKVARPGTAVIILTMYDSEAHVVEALQSGAAGYLVKDSSRDLFCHAIHAVVDGGVMVRSSLLRQALQGVSRAPGRPGEGEAGSGVRQRLTVRELEVLRLLVRGSPNREIARELHLAEVTVKKYVQSIIGKLGASDRTHAATLAVQAGLVE